MKYFTKMHIALVRVILIAATIVMLGGYPFTLYAASELPYTFSPGQTISSAQVNANFQALSAQITALQAQLAPVSPVSIVGIYDYFSFGIGMERLSSSATEYDYNVTRNSYHGTLVFDGSGTVKINATGGYDSLRIHNSLSDVYQPNSTTDSFLVNNSISETSDYHPIGTDLKSTISGSFSHEYPTDIGEGTYTVNGSTVTMGGGAFVGTLSADGKILVGTINSNTTGIMIGIRRPPTITNATSSTADGRYNAGASINITLNFSEAVTSTGLTIALNSGATITTGAISNIPIWIGTYTVGTGQASSDLSVSAVTGTIASVYSASNPTIPAGKNIGDNKAIVIE